MTGFVMSALVASASVRIARRRLRGLACGAALLACAAGGAAQDAASARDMAPVQAPVQAPAAAPGPASARIAPAPARPGRARPVVAVVGHNTFTELTDYVVPYGVLKLADVAEVLALGTGPGPVRLFPAFSVVPDASLAAFDARFPEGADYVVVPAVHEDDDPALLDWVRQQRAKGATVIGICDGAWVLARAGVLDGRRATGHWYSRSALARQFPRTRWVQDRRYVVDGPVVTTTGVSASVPVSLALVEAIGGRARAIEVARRLGAGGWDDAYDAAPFQLGVRDLYTAARNWLAFWRHETLGAALRPGADDVALALVADAYARTYRTQVVATAPSPAGVRLRSGLVFLPERHGAALPAPLPDAGAGLPAVPALAAALRGIAARYDDATAGFVALQLEYPEARRPIH